MSGVPSHAAAQLKPLLPDLNQTITGQATVNGAGAVHAIERINDQTVNLQLVHGHVGLAGNIAYVPMSDPNGGDVALLRALPTQLGEHLSDVRALGREQIGGMTLVRFQATAAGNAITSLVTPYLSRPLAASVSANPIKLTIDIDPGTGAPVRMNMVGTMTVNLSSLRRVGLSGVVFLTDRGTYAYSYSKPAQVESTSTAAPASASRLSGLAARVASARNDEAQGDFQRAVVAWQTVLTADPRVAFYYEQLAYSAFRARDRSLGELAAAKALSLAPLGQRSALREALAMARQVG
jgi:hypothetical protein